jgi:hypothetical protein
MRKTLFDAPPPSVSSPGKSVSASTQAGALAILNCATSFGADRAMRLMEWLCNRGRRSGQSVGQSLLRAYAADRSQKDRKRSAG